MSQHTEKRNFHTIYIRKSLLPVWKEFLELIKKDAYFKKLRYKESDGLISIAIMQLINDYVMSQKNETSNKIDNSEEDANQE